MKITCLAANQLDAKQIQQWSALQSAHPDLSSPLFRPELVLETAALRPQLEIAVLRQAGATVGFLPYFRDKDNIGRPFAGCLTGVQGVVADGDAVWEAADLLRKCRLSSLQFDHLLASQSPFTAYHHVQGESPYMDLSNGFEAYRQERRRAKSDELQETLRKTRKLQRDKGPLRFEPYCRDASVLDTLLQWKNEQLHKMKVYNHLRPRWVRQLMLQLMERNEEQFAGMLSAAFIDDELLAVSMGVRSKTVIHGWVTAYNPCFAKYSPGLILYAQIAQAAEQLGVLRIDMGQGPEPYKRSFRSGGIALAEASIESRLLRGAAQRSYAQLKAQARNSPIGKHARFWLSRWRYARQRFFESQQM